MAQPVPAFIGPLQARVANRKAIVRLIGALLPARNEEWPVQRARYMTPETIAPVGEDAVVSLPAVAS
ncbi:hypothetical protein D2T32_12775 [Sinirhodobacter populi]|nr:hypothetical protein D2T32_12775 [Sinirhodobacter populi]